MKRLLCIPLLLLVSASALAIEISESMLNTYVAQKLAEKRQRDVHVLDPKITLLDGYATICAKVRAKVFAQDIDFCANMTPAWRQETGSLLATRMALVSLNAPGVKEKDVELLKAIVNQAVLPRLEGTEVYKTDDFIGKQISGLKVLPGKLDISL
jgi:hypothetical protein